MGDKKVAYLFTETRSVNRWFGLYIDGRIPILQSLRKTAKELRKLRKEDYIIIDTDVPFSNLLRDTHKFKEIDEGDRKALEIKDKELAHFEKYPGLFPKELEKLNKLKEKGIKPGVLWVSDVDLYKPNHLAMLREEVGSSMVQTIYYLSAGGDSRLVGRIYLDQYAILLSYFADALTLRNTTSEEAKEFSRIGRCLKETDLEFLVSRKLVINPL